MYKVKEKAYGAIAILYYLIYFIAMFIAGIMYQNNRLVGMFLPYLLAFAIGIAIVIIKEKSIKSLGFCGGNIKFDCMVSTVIIIISFVVVLLIKNLTFAAAFKQMLYYLLFIAVIEEIVFRGIIQSYLFGLRINKFAVFFIGAILFSLIHIPFQMFVHDEVSVHYFITAIPNLIETFAFHFVFCAIASKRKNIILSITLHFVYDFL